MPIKMDFFRLEHEGPDWTCRPDPSPPWRYVGPFGTPQDSGVSGQATMPVFPPAPAPPPVTGEVLQLQLAVLTKQVADLLRLLGLSPEERGFLQALLSDPGDRDLMLVLADWLEERGRAGASQRMRELGSQ